MSPNVAPPTITFSLLSPVIEESLSSFSPQPNINTLFSPPLPLQPFAKDRLEEEEENFEEIFKHFSFSVPISPPCLQVKKVPTTSRDQGELSPRMKQSFNEVRRPVQATIEEEERKFEGKKELEATTEDDGGKFTNCRKWLEGCEAARREREEEERVLFEATKEEAVVVDPHPIYSRRASISKHSRPSPVPSTTIKLPPLASLTRTDHNQQQPFTNLVENPPRRKQSDSSSLTCASSSPYSSLASTPQTSPTSSSFPSQGGSKPSSIRSTSSKFSTFSSKFSLRRKSTSSSSDKKPSTISFSSPPLPPLPPRGGQFLTPKDLPSLAELFPPSAPTPSLLISGSNVKEVKTRKRRDSMLGNWRDEREKSVLREKLDEAYKRIERDDRAGMGRRLKSRPSPHRLHTLAFNVSSFDNLSDHELNIV
ncbi:hypothetical protein JCM5353_002174 [Sporobolomyces roseus]